MTKILIEKKRRTQRIKTSSWQGSVKISLISLLFVILAGVLCLSVFYLYQVNDMAAKGFEIKKIEQEIDDLKEKSKQFRIKEIELRSMYNIEEEAQNLDLVSCAEISYIEEKGPVAMNQSLDR